MHPGYALPVADTGGDPVDVKTMAQTAQGLPAMDMAAPGGFGADGLAPLEILRATGEDAVDIALDPGAAEIGHEFLVGIGHERDLRRAERATGEPVCTGPPAESQPRSAPAVTRPGRHPHG